MAGRSDPTRPALGRPPSPREGGSARILPGLFPGLVALAFIALLIGGAFVGLMVETARNPAGAVSAFDTYLLRIAGFTLWQAALSTVLSVAPAIVVARALSRHPRFPGRAALLRLFSLPLALPAVVAALGMLALYGRAGFLAPLLGWFAGGDWPGIYGLSGILAAHVFFNLPLAVRMILHGWQAIPAERFRRLRKPPARRWPRLR